MRAREKDWAAISRYVGGGALAGGAVAWWFDPQSGRRRRAQARNKVDHWVNATRHWLDMVSRDFSHRVHGLWASAWSRTRRAQVTDDVLAARVRARLGRVSSHPGAIEVSVAHGQVTLAGPVLAREVKRVVRAVERVHGVRSVESRLEPHLTPDNVPGLQGGVPRPRWRMELLQTNWSPSFRLLMGSAGALSAGLAFTRRARPMWPLAAGGTVVFLRALTNLPLARLFGLSRRPAIVMHKTIHIDAPIDEVFEAVARFENWPRYFEHIDEVRDNRDGTWRWRVKGPAHVPLEWNVRVTEVVPGELFAWRSVPGALVVNEGVARCEIAPDGSTRLDIRLSYTPPAGAVGHAVARALGHDPKHILDQDLLRLKSLLEQGRTRAHGREVTIEEVEGEKPSGP